MSKATSPAEILELVAGVRRVFESTLDASLGHTRTQGACLYGSILLAESLQRFSTCSVVIRGGGNGDGGFLDQAGELQGHYWVEAHSPVGDAWVLDISADQFGQDSVQMLSLHSAEARRYRPGAQADVDEVVRDELQRIAAGARESGQH